MTSDARIPVLGERGGCDRDPDTLLLCSDLLLYGPSTR
jgi:hypothetical protein